MYFYTSVTTPQIEVWNIPSFTVGSPLLPPKDNNYCGHCLHIDFICLFFELHINRNIQYVLTSVVRFIHVCVSKWFFFIAV